MPVGHAQTGNPELDRVLNEIIGLVNRLERIVVGIENVILKQPLTTSNTRVRHGLGRRPRGFLVTRKNANAVVYSDTEETVDPANWIQLKASATVTADLLFY